MRVDVPDVQAEGIKYSLAFEAASDFRSQVVNQFSGSRIETHSFTLPGRMISVGFSLSRNVTTPDWVRSIGFLEYLFQYFAVVDNALTHSLMCEISRRRCRPLAMLTVNNVEEDTLNKTADLQDLKWQFQNRYHISAKKFAKMRKNVRNAFLFFKKLNPMVY